MNLSDYKLRNNCLLSASYRNIGLVYCASFLDKAACLPFPVLLYEDVFILSPVPPF